MPGQTRKSAPATTPIFPSGGKVLDLRLWHWTDDVAEALAAEAAGVDRIGLDIERLGKAERQAGLASWISPHELSALPALRATLGRAQLFVRVNMLHPDSASTSSSTNTTTSRIDCSPRARRICTRRSSGRPASSEPSMRP